MKENRDSLCSVINAKCFKFNVVRWLMNLIYIHIFSQSKNDKLQIKCRFAQSESDSTLEKNT